MTRPYLTKVHAWEWTNNQTGTKTPGIALRQGRRFVVHLTAGEAIQLANRLVDLAETLEVPHEPPR